MSSTCSSPTVNSWIRVNKLSSRALGSRTARFLSMHSMIPASPNSSRWRRCSAPRHAERSPGRSLRVQELRLGRACQRPANLHVGARVHARGEPRSPETRQHDRGVRRVGFQQFFFYGVNGVDHPVGSMEWLTPRVAPKIRPAVARFDRPRFGFSAIEVAFNVRLFFDRFETSDFGRFDMNKGSKFDTGVLEDLVF